jgi:hypothetical protein
MTNDATIYPFPIDMDWYGKRKIVSHTKTYVMGTVHTNSIENAFSLLKRGLFGTFHKVSIKHLQRYLTEFSYRFNRRSMQSNYSQRPPRISYEGKISNTRCSLLRQNRSLRAALAAALYLFTWHRFGTKHLSQKIIELLFFNLRNVREHVHSDYKSGALSHSATTPISILLHLPMNQSLIRSLLAYL